MRAEPAHLRPASENRQWMAPRRQGLAVEKGASAAPTASPLGSSWPLMPASRNRSSSLRPRRQRPRTSGARRSAPALTESPRSTRWRTTRCRLCASARPGNRCPPRSRRSGGAGRWDPIRSGRRLPGETAHPSRPRSRPPRRSAGSLRNAARRWSRSSRSNTPPRSKAEQRCKPPTARSVSSGEFDTQRSENGYLRCGLPRRGACFGDGVGLGVGK